MTPETNPRSETETQSELRFNPSLDQAEFGPIRGPIRVLNRFQDPLNPSQSERSPARRGSQVDLGRYQKEIQDQIRLGDGRRLS